ncbi:unnamed protein product, partial [Adineta ricciae]
NFLLSPITQTTSSHQKSDTTTAALSSNHLIHGILPSDSTLHIFIRSQLRARGGVINVGRSLTKFPLVESITVVDEFDTWNFDQLRDLFELILVPEGEKFPLVWELASDVQILYLFELYGRNKTNNYENPQTNRNADQPSRASLEQFVIDVCEKENNGMTNKWLQALYADDIIAFDHLANLNFA